MFRKNFYLQKMSIVEKTVLILAVLGMGLTVLWWSVSSLKVTSVQFENFDGSLHESVLPVSVAAPFGSVAGFTVKIHKNWLTRQDVRILPDDEILSLALNGQDLHLEELAQGPLNDWQKGFSYPLGRFLRTGENVLVFSVLNHSGMMGLDIYTDFGDRQGVCVFMFGLFCLMCVLWIFLRRAGIPWNILLVIFLGVVIWCVYALITPWNERAQDVVGHVQYIDYVFERWRIPGAYQGWEYFQPPLYYFSAAGFKKILDVCGFKRASILKALQFQSLIYILGFVIVSFMTICLAREDRCKYKKGAGKDESALMIGLLMFWPSLIIHSARIGNDSLLYLLSAVSFYFVMKWWISDRIAYFQWASFFAALGMLTKSNAVILFFGMGLLFLIRWFTAENRGWRIFIQKTWPVWVIFISVVMFNYYGPFFDMLFGLRTHLLVLNLQWLSDFGFVENRIKTFLWFDLKNFLIAPYLSCQDGGQGCQLFWNYLLKTSLFSEYSFSDNQFVVALAKGLSCGLLFIIIFPFMRVFKRKVLCQKFSSDLPMAVFVFLYLAGVFFYRISAPFYFCGDFRFIVPILTSVIYFYCTTIDYYRSAGWHWAVWAGKIAGWGFCLLSGLFVILLVLQY